MQIKYITVLIDTSMRGAGEVKRFEFDTVEDAVDKHIAESKGHYSDTSYWDICVEYTV